MWIQSLPESERGPSTRIKEDLERIFVSRGRSFIDITVSTRDELLETLTYLEKLALEGIRPILHFDMHGSKDKGLVMAPSGECISWDDLAVSIRKINVATENNLCCVFATCFALHFAYETDILKPTLFYLIIAPLEEVEIGFLEDRTNKFYQSFMATGNIITAYKNSLTPKMQLWTCQVIFVRGLVTYIRTQTKGKGAQQRRENLLTQHLQTQYIANPTQIREARKAIRAFMKPDQQIIDRYAPTFLIGRKPACTFADLEAKHTNNMSTGTDQ